MTADGGSWRVWLGGKSRSGKNTNETASRQVKPDEASDEVSGKSIAGSSSQAGETISFQSDESISAPQADSDDKQNVTVTEKEEKMQTAKQIKPISDSGITSKTATGEEGPVKEIKAKEASVKRFDGDLASLFGPVIEDDTKGVRNQIRELIQCELQGELGQRFSRNLRIVIRREIAAAVDEQFDRV